MSQFDESRVVYILKGSPIPLSRTRIGRCYYAPYESQKELKLATQITIQNQHGEKPCYKGPLKLEVIFYFHIPKNHLDIKSGDPIIKDPTVNDCLRFILNVCNNIIFYDVSTVTEIYCKKIYDTNPRTEFIITELK